MKILWYEDLQDNMSEVIEDLCSFLDVEALDDVAKERLIRHCSFDKMKANSAVNSEYLIDENGEKSFIRNGKVKFNLLKAKMESD